MQPLLTIDIAQISVAERIQLAEDLWDSILENPEMLPVTDAQRQELDARLQKYRQTPEAESSWQSVKDRLNSL